MEISKKDIAEVGQAVENLGRLVEQQFQLVQEELNHLSRYSAEILSQLQGLQKRVAGIEASLDEVQERAEEFSFLRQELVGLSRSLEKLWSDLQQRSNKSEKPSPE